MGFLRRTSTRRLLAICATFLAVSVAGTAIALAATGGGPTPPPKPLAQAIHDALAAKPVAGVTARIQFTNHLIDQSSLSEGADPLLTGATGRLWAAPGGHLRIELQTTGGSADSQVLLNGGVLTIFDASSNTVFRVHLPRGGAQGGKASGNGRSVPGVAQIRKALATIEQQAVVSGAVPTDVVGQPAYSVRITPRSSGGLIGAAQVAWDAAHGVPLSVGVFARGSSSPVLELRATSISFGTIPASTFAIQPPAGARVVDLTPPASAGANGAGNAAAPVTGLSAVQSHLPFKLSAPAQLAGRTRTDVRLIARGGHSAALITYGSGLDSLVVVEAQANGQSGTGSASSGTLHGLSLPTVSVPGATARELPTALGTVITFERSGVRYIVAGSVPPATAATAARGL